MKTATKKQYVIAKTMAGTKYYYEKLVVNEIIWNADINLAKVFDGVSTARKARTGIGAARWKIEDAPIKKHKMTLVIAPSIDQYHYYLREHKVVRDDQNYKYVTSVESIRGSTPEGCCVVIVNRFLCDGNREDAIDLAFKRGLGVTSFKF